MVHWLAIGSTLGYRAFTAAAAHTDTIDYVTCSNQTKTRLVRQATVVTDHTRAGVTLGSALTLLGLVAQPTGLVRSGGSRSAVEVGQLTVLPATDAEQEAHHIGLLLAP